MLGARLSGLVIPRVGAVVSGHETFLPWLVVDSGGVEVAESSEYLRHAVATGFSPSSVKSYARALLRWLRFLWAVEVAWDRAATEQKSVTSCCGCAPRRRTERGEQARRSRAA